MMSAFTSLLSGPSGPLRHVDPRKAVGEQLERMPLVHRLLLENILRQQPADVAKAGQQALTDWLATGRSEVEIPFIPERILMHDTTCGPALVDIAALRDVLAMAGGDPARLNPVCPVATSTDHSVAIDLSAHPQALSVNMQREMERNAERYRFMKWAAQSIRGFRVFPPGTGIMHTINMEYLAPVVCIKEIDGENWVVPDTLIGTDSHTPMINSLGILGWGVGGIEAEAVMFGVPLGLRVPEVIGVELTGALPPGVMATDLALAITHRLRKLGVAGAFVEYFGPGIASLSVGERSVIANMAPEYGASTGFFPIDERTLSYLHDTGRSAATLALVESLARALGLWYEPDARPVYTQTIHIDLSLMAPTLAGPCRPHDALFPANVAAALAPLVDGAKPGGRIPDDAVAIAAITSCTNTTDMGLLVAAALLARKARALGLKPPAWVKTSFAPGSPAARQRLERAGLLDDLEAIGFGISAYGCTTCIGNSGPLLPVMEEAMQRYGIKPVIILSGNRNFPGRVHAALTSAILASPALVIAWALKGRGMIDVTKDILATTETGNPVRLADLWPSAAEIDEALRAAIDPADIKTAYAAAEALPRWQALEAPASECFPWDPASTYLCPPPFVGFGTDQKAVSCFTAHPLLVLGDDVTTDHISPASAISANSDAGRYLIAHGDDPADLNVFASRRGHWEVMLRGLFTNKTVVNLLSAAAKPGQTVYAPSGEILPLFQAALRYEAAGLERVIVAGERYGTGSSRDWAAKGLRLLGVKAVLAQSFERIHRSNLIFMGILPLSLPSDWRPERLSLQPGDEFDIHVDLAALVPRALVRVVLRRTTGGMQDIFARAELETRSDVALIRAGGVFPLILRRALAA